MSGDHYATLGIARDATQADIKEAFRRLAYLHPDQHPGDPTAVGRFKVVTEAYAALSDPVKRAAYDTRPPSTGHVTEAVELVTEIIAGAQSIDPARAGLGLLDKAASPEGRQQIRGFWRTLRSFIG